jgi:polysaccharide deacetylase 2 family uncharacterized protein YibQ
VGTEDIGKSGGDLHRPAATPRRRRRSPGWRALGYFWLAILAVVVTGGLVFDRLGPPARPPALAAAQGSPGGKAGPQPAPAPITAPPTAGLGSAQAPAPAAPGTIQPPDPALLEPSSVFPGGMLPRIGPDGRAPMHTYAAPAEAADARPRIALLLGGIGLAEADSEAAIRELPSTVSLAVSPYAFQPERLLTEARAAGHELFLALPMEPAQYPLDDPGDHALLTGNAPAVNAQRLEWALTRFAGYVGATGALNGMRGERFAGAPELMDPVLHTLAGRGLLYIDPRPGAPRLPYAAGRDVDVVVDEPAVRSEIEANLARLEQVARDHGAALGLVSVPRPVTLDRIAAWAATLGNRGIALVPVSAIAQSPPSVAAARAAPNVPTPQ